MRQRQALLLLSLHQPAGPGQFVPGPGVNAVKRLAVSTGRLRPLLALHPRPIDLVVFQEPSPLAGPETSSRGGFHA